MGDDDTTHLRRKDELARVDAADLLESIARQLRDGSVDLDGVELDVPGRIHFDIEVKDSPKPDGTKHELELELWWMDT